MKKKNVVDGYITKRKNNTRTLFFALVKHGPEARERERTRNRSTW